MHREGHLGAALAVYSPLGFLVHVAGFPSAAVAGGVGAALLVMVPDQDIRIPLVSHRGITHTVWFALLVGSVLGAAAGYLGVRGGMGAEDALVVGAFAFAVGVVTIASHILADALTPMGVKPFAPLRGRKYTVAVATASNPIANYGLLFLGALSAGGALYLATIVAG
jgi:inner membrane protein